MKYLISLMLFTFTATIAQAAPYNIGDTPHDLLGKYRGKEVKISDYRGKVVIISFWATWCPPCMKELPVLSGIQKSAGTDELQVIAINHKEGANQFRRIVKALDGTPMQLLSDPKGRTGKHFGVEGIPHMVIVDRDGKVAAVHIGYGDSQLPALVNEINEIASRPSSH